MTRFAALGLVLALLLAPPALADGDPASDTLVGATVGVFMTYSASDPSLERSLQVTTRAAAAAGLPIKVAVIADKNDLGAIPQLFGQPQTYASYLGAELRFWYTGTLLTVMPQGFGVSGPYPLARAHTALAGLAPANATPRELAAAADRAIRALAAAAGHPIARPGHSGGELPYSTIAIALLAAVGGGVLAVTVDRRRSRRSSPVR